MVFTFIQISTQRFIVARLREAKPEMCTPGDFVSQRLVCICQVQNKSHQSIALIHDPSSCWKWMFPHTLTIYKGKTQSLFFCFFFCFFQLVSTSLLYCWCWHCFGLLSLNFNFLLQIKSNRRDVIDPISATELLHGRKWKQQISEKTLVVLCCVTDFTLVLHRGFGDTQFNFCNTHTEIERPTLTDNKDSEKCEATDHCSQPTLYCRCQEFLIKSSVNTLLPQELAVMSVFFVLKPHSIFPFFFFYCQDAKLHQIWHHMIAGHCALRRSSTAYIDI